MTLFSFLSVKGTVSRERLLLLLFSIFASILGGYKCHFNDLKWGQKWTNKKKKIYLSIDH
jgi:hypothetical protein